MTSRSRIVLGFAAVGFVAIAPLRSDAQSAGRITSPKEEFGHNFGDDYFLATYKQISAYWQKLDRESDRMILQDIGRTAEGRTHLMAIVTSPANHRRLAAYKAISRRLALAEGLSDSTARALAKEGKAVVWIDGGLHATETLGAQQLGEMVYQMVSRNDDETLRILDAVIILFVHANPDGNDLVADWYMRRAAPEQRSLAGVPRLYQKYIGHDNNRDFFASTQPETENINRVLYHEWFPQILYNHHQSGPAGTVFWSPPLRDPYNYNLDPLLILGFQSLGAAMHSRLAVEGKPGATMRSGGPYDGWWNGGIRNTAAFHNTIALLTEMVGSPTPMRIPLVMQRQLPSADLAYPIAPQAWHFRQSVDYSISLNRAILDYASRMRENLLFGIYAMGRRSIERGLQDTWTPNPKRYAEVAAKLSGPRPGDNTPPARREELAWAELRRLELRDPRAYIISANQRDFPTATKFINALRETGITVHRATRDFAIPAVIPSDARNLQSASIAKTYPAGSFVIWTAQSFRPHVIDMFEPQVHPDVFPYPGAPPTPPYDNAGWTLAFQMGVEFDRILDPVTIAGLEPVTAWNLPMPPGLTTPGGRSGFIMQRRQNNAYIAANRLVKAGEIVRVMPGGGLFVRSTGSNGRSLDSLASELGVSFVGTSIAIPGSSPRLRGARIGLWDQYGGSIDAGWARWILEQFEFPFERVFAPQLDAGNLNAKYDALVFVSGGIPGSSPRRGGGQQQPIPDIPAEYQAQVGRVTAEQTLPRIKEFIENGGTVIAIGESAPPLAAFLKLPIENHLVENGAPLPRTKLYVPGSVLSARVDTTHAIASGMEQYSDFFFDDSPAFKLGPNAAAVGVTPIAWFDTPTPLRSGWAWGQHYLENGVVAIEAKVGKGKAIFYGPEILKRAQPHPTFKLLFNAIYDSASR
ncbi:MAG: M14 family metallopeptidase [Gemmatimonadaceae bacterium]